MDLNKEILDKVRNIEGFPIGKDEDIIKLSDPPYYTACPNPFINEFIVKNGTPYDEESENYNVEPYTANVSEGKNDPIYNAHSYHTKVPHKAIMKYILHYTKPGDIVFDGFCGTGMTGVAAQMCGSPDEEYKIKIEQEMGRVQWGIRKTILCDLSPAATFIAYNYNKDVDSFEFKNEIDKIINDVEKEFGWVYETIHNAGGIEQKNIDRSIAKGKINYIIWADVFICPTCAKEIDFWDFAINKDTREIKQEFNCPECNSEISKSNLENAWSSVFDVESNSYIQQKKQKPVLINYFYQNKRYEKIPDKYDLDIINRIEDINIEYWYPKYKIPLGEKTKEALNTGYIRTDYFFTKRNLLLLAKLLSVAEKSEHFRQVMFVLTSFIVKTGSRLHNVGLKSGKINLAGAMPNALYFPSLMAERNILDLARGKVDDILKIFKYRKDKNQFMVSCQSTTNLGIPQNTIDYIFVDPPFGYNLMYSELNYIWESWLKVFTNNKKEAIINKVQAKKLKEYQELMEKCFIQLYNALKPGRWMTVEFHNSQNSIWNAIQEAILKAGFVIADTKILDKKQGTFNQMTGSLAVKKDLVISAYKPKSLFVQRFLKEAGTEEGVWDFIREHLSKLPVVVENKGMLDIIPERQNYLLYDSMLAFHIQKGASVPLGAADFYLGLKQRFPERDSMYFLPGQVSIYDAKRIKEELNEQLSFIVLDEKTAIQWLHKELGKHQTYQDIQPKFLQELKQLKYEEMPELLGLLDENFLQDEQGKWYVPDVNKQSDLEKLRDKKLLKEFDEYRGSKGKLKKFRTEAIRVGFKHCWREKDYKTIANIGERMPEIAVQEDPSILMYYDNALTRIGDLNV